VVHSLRRLSHESRVDGRFGAVVAFGGVVAGMVSFEPSAQFVALGTGFDLCGAGGGHQVDAQVAFAVARRQNVVLASDVAPGALRLGRLLRKLRLQQTLRIWLKVRGFSWKLPHEILTNAAFKFLFTKNCRKRDKLVFRRKHC